MQSYWPVRSQDDAAAQELRATALLHLVNLHIVTDALREYMVCDADVVQGLSPLTSSGALGPKVFFIKFECP